MTIAHVVSRGPDSHTPGASLVKLLYLFCSADQTPIPVLFCAAHKKPLIKNRVTGRHESVEIVRAKICLFKSSRPCASYYLCVKYLMRYLLLLRMLSTIFDFHGYRSLTRLSPRVWDSGRVRLELMLEEVHLNSTQQNDWNVITLPDFSRCSYLLWASPFFNQLKWVRLTNGCGHTNLAEHVLSSKKLAIVYSLIV